MKQPKDSESSAASGRRPPEYVIVAASPWVKERCPAARANLWDALQVGKDQHRDPTLKLNHDHHPEVTTRDPDYY